MPELFTKVTDDEGNESYVPVTEETEVELPETLIKAHPEYQRVSTLYGKAVDESKKRLTRAQKAEQMIKELADDTEKPEGDDEPKDDGKPANVPLDVDALTEKIFERLIERNTQEQTAQQKKDAEIADLITKHKLAGVQDVVKILANSSNPAETAELLGRSAAKFDTSQSGGETIPTNIDEMDFSGVLRKMGLPTKK